MPVVGWDKVHEEKMNQFYFFVKMIDSHPDCLVLVITKAEAVVTMRLFVIYLFQRAGIHTKITRQIIT